jgi:hypothetical protein
MLPETAGAQPVTATVVLKSGERHTGQNLQHRAGNEVSLRKSVSDQLRVSPDQVAYVDFGGGDTPSVSLTGAQQAVVLRNGTVIKGQVLEMAHSSFEDPSTPYQVVVRDEQGQERRLRADQVGRVYFAGGAPAASSPQSTSEATTGRGGIVVPGSQEWTSTGLTVKRGETLRFNVTGEIQLSADANDIAGSAGARNPRYAQNAPMPRALAGALIARIGNGRPFPIGDQNSVTMPESGQLYLGINDDHVGDNRGEFRVEIERGGPIRRR